MAEIDQVKHALDGWLKLPYELPQSQPRMLVIGIVLVLVSALWLRVSSRNSPEKAKIGSSDSSGTPRAVNRDRRVPGTWTPVKFRYPTITPLPSDPMKTEPIPYRPFRWDHYHVTMGIRSMPWNEYIEVDNQFESYHKIRLNRIATRGKNVIRVQDAKPGVVQSGVAAAIELLHEVAEYLPQRYPQTFEICRYSEEERTTSSSDEAPSIQSITIIPLGKTYELPSRDETRIEVAEQALEIASLLVQEDIALMVEGTDGKYYFQAGAILVAGSWRLQDKIGLQLVDIHTSGGVPRYKEKLQTSMDRFFERLPVDKPVARNNYTFQVVPPRDPTASDVVDPEELAWSEIAHGPEDDYLKKKPEAPNTPPEVAISNVRLRTERQTLRRLPRSGAIAFTIRSYMTPVEKIGKEPGVAKRLASSMRAWGEDVGAYKGKPTGGWYDLVLDYLDQCGTRHDETSVRDEDRYPF